MHDAFRPQTVKTSAALRANAHDKCPSRWLDNSPYGGGNIRTPMRVWLSEALMRSRNYMESLDDYTYACWRGHDSFDDARNSGTRASSYPGARRLRHLPSQRRSRNWSYATSATRRSCCWSRSRRRCGTSTVLPSVDRRKRNDNQTLVSAGRSPPAAYCRCSHIDLWSDCLPKPLDVKKPSAM